MEHYGKVEPVADIIKSLNARQIKAPLGRECNKNGFHRLLRTKRYIRIYLYKGEEIPGGMPCIIYDEAFERVRRILEKSKALLARNRGKEDDLLTAKLFCGYCREIMTGYGGIGKSGKAYPATPPRTPRSVCAKRRSWRRSPGTWISGRKRKMG